MMVCYNSHIDIARMLVGEYNANIDILDMVSAIVRLFYFVTPLHWMIVFDVLYYSLNYVFGFQFLVIFCRGYRYFNHIYQ